MYQAPVSEIQFCLNHVLGFDRLAKTERFAEATGETAEAILTEAARLCEDVLNPLQRAGDQHPARLENGVVRCSPGFREGYQAIAGGGWVGIAADPAFGGMGLPLALASCVGEMMGSACMALHLAPLLAQGQIEAVECHASDTIKALYLPKLISGEWTATMNLTEPQAGSDVGALRTRAEPAGGGTYRVTGQKIFITYGDHDVAENICHMVLARLPDGAAGTRGLSLFLVPKFIPDARGNPGVGNSLKPISLEHKMGLHGSPTAVMEFDAATGWLIGEEHGGMAAMFTMMNSARLGVAIQGVSVAEASYQKALEFARERRQGPTAEQGEDAIIGHADVRRMLMRMKVLTLAARALCLDLAVSLDMATATGDAGWVARAAFLTPLAKSFASDTGCDVADIGIQVHGGMGFIEETGAAQYFRDARVTRIYEGTNGIQAMDLVGRKLRDGGAAAFALLDEISKTDPSLASAVADLRATTQAVLEMPDINDRCAGAVAYQRAFALLLGGHYLFCAASDGDSRRTALARFYAAHLLPEVAALCASARVGAEGLYALDRDELAL